MVSRNSSTTILLVLIVIALIIGLAIAIYHVLDWDWLEKSFVQIYSESLNQKEENVIVETKMKIKYDISKRKHNILLSTDEFKVIIYKDGTAGVTMLENEKYKEISDYTNIVNTEVKLTMTNIIRAYEIDLSKNYKTNKYIILLDSDGNLYKFAEQELIENSIYSFAKVEGISKIIDVRQIINNELNENNNRIDAIAIDEESNEILLSNFLEK